MNRMGMGIILVGLGLLGGCAVSTEESPGEQAPTVGNVAPDKVISSLRATAETEDTTGVYAWHGQFEAAKLVIYGLDRKGRVRFKEELTRSGGEGERLITAEVLYPSRYEYVADASGIRREVGSAADPKVKTLLTRFEFDALAQNNTEAGNVSYNDACDDAYKAGLSCYPASRVCTSPLTCVPAVVLCTTAAYCTAQCVSGNPECDVTGNILPKDTRTPEERAADEAYAEEMWNDAQAEAENCFWNPNDPGCGGSDDSSSGSDSSSDSYGE